MNVTLYTSSCEFYLFPTHEALEKARTDGWELTFTVALVTSGYKTQRKVEWGISALPTIPANTPIQIVEKRGKFWKVISDNQTGWILLHNGLWETFSEYTAL